MLWRNIKIIATLFCGWIFLYFLHTFVIQIIPEIIYQIFFLIFLVGFIFEVTSQITYLSDFVDGIFIFNQIK